MEKGHARFPLFANPPLTVIDIYLNRHNNLNCQTPQKSMSESCLDSMPSLMQFLHIANAFAISACGDTLDTVRLAAALLGAAITMTITAHEPEYIASLELWGLV